MIDEWQALIQQQLAADEAAKVHLHEQKINKQEQYMRELDQQVMAMKDAKTNNRQALAQENSDNIAKGA